MPTAAFQEEVIGWRKKEMPALLSRGIARGEVLVPFVSPRD